MLINIEVLYAYCPLTNAIILGNADPKISGLHRLKLEMHQIGEKIIYF